MSWNDVVGHAAARQRLERTWRSGRMASTWLFAGPDGTGKRTFALQLARTLLCERNRGNPFDSCDSCPGCLQVANGGHPDLLRVARPADKSRIPIELLIGDRESRNDEGLCRSIAMKPVRGLGKVAIIDDADDFNQEGANALLKTLEEPPPGTVLILLGTSVNRQIPTILSRCQVIRFDPLRPEEVVRILAGLPDFQPTRPREELAAVSGGNVQMAMLLNDPSVWEGRDRWLRHLSRLDPAADEESKRLAAFAEEAGKDNSLKRERMMMVADVAIGFFEALMLCLCGVARETDPATAAAVTETVASDTLAGRQLQPDWLARCIDRTLVFQEHIVANVSLNSALDGWLDDLSGLLSGRLPPALVW